MGTYTTEQIAEMKRSWPNPLTDEEAIEALDRAERAKAKRQAKKDKAKAELVAKGAQLPVGAPPVAVAQTPKPVAVAEAVAKMPEGEFILRAIRKLQKPPWKGIHSVYSGFNRAFADYYGKTSIEATAKAAAAGLIEQRPVKGGMMLYNKGEAPASGKSDVLGQILDD